MKLFKVAILTIAVYLAVILTIRFMSEDLSVKGNVVGKHEAGGKCYVEIAVEVTPEEYIGLDIGDEMELIND